MPLFTLATARSVDAAAAVELADRLTECASFQELTQTSTAAAALDSVYVAEATGPWNKEEFTQEELEQRHCWANVIDPFDEGDESVFLGLGVNELNQSGMVGINLYWKPAAADMDGEDGRRDCKLYFWDRTAAIKNEIWAAVYASAFQCPRLQSVRVLGRGWTTDEMEVCQGAMLSCAYLTTWGDLEQ